MKPRWQHAVLCSWRHSESESKLSRSNPNTSTSQLQAVNVNLHGNKGWINTNGVTWLKFEHRSAPKERVYNVHMSPAVSVLWDGHEWYAAAGSVALLIPFYPVIFRNVIFGETVVWHVFGFLFLSYVINCTAAHHQEAKIPVYTLKRPISTKQFASVRCCERSL